MHLRLRLRFPRALRSGLKTIRLAAPEASEASEEPPPLECVSEPEVVDEVVEVGSKGLRPFPKGFYLI